MKKIVSYLLIIICSTIVGYLLLFATFLLPNTNAKYNVCINTENFVIEGDNPLLIGNNYATSYGGFTDELMLMEAVYDGNERIPDKATNVYHYNLVGASENNPSATMAKIQDILFGSASAEKISYSRYWHGYLIVLKPLLSFIDYFQIRYFNMVLQPLLILLVVFLMNKQGLKEMIIPFIISLLVIYPSAIMMCISHSIIFYLLMFELIILLSFYNKLKDKLDYFFLFAGILTSFFDYLTWPLVTLGVPLIIVLVKEKELLIKKKIVLLLKLCVIWGFGYLLMWLMKPLFGSVITQKNLLLDAYNQLLIRLGAKGGSFVITPLMSINNNYSLIFNRTNVLCLLLLIGYIIFCLCTKKLLFRKENLSKNSLLLLVSIFPIIWYSVVLNHSYTHNIITYRLVMISVFAILLFFRLLFDKPTIRKITLCEDE